MAEVLAWQNRVGGKVYRCTMNPIGADRWRIVLKVDDTVTRHVEVNAHTQRDAAKTAAEWFKEHITATRRA